MKKIMKKLFLTVFATVSLVVLQGCAAVKPMADEKVLKVVDGNVVRMTVTWGEHADKGMVPASYNNEAHYYNWTPEVTQYRWIQVTGGMRRDVYGFVFRRVRVPDGMPLLQPGDWVDVYNYPDAELDYSQLKASVVVAFVCANADKVCKEKSKKELGGENEVVSKGAPDMSKLKFTKKFDTQGNLLK